jgi:hypothetical protein
MAAVIFAYSGEGAEAEQFIIDERNGLLRLSIRGEPIPVLDMHDNHQLRPGPMAQMTLPQHVLAELIHKLLEVPIVEEMVGAVPFVLYFRNNDDRDEFLRQVAEVKPDLVERSLDRPRHRPRRNSGG